MPSGDLRESSDVRALNWKLIHKQETTLLSLTACINGVFTEIRKALLKLVVCVSRVMSWS